MEVSLYVSNQLEGVELHLGTKETTKSLWVRIKGRAGTGNFMVGFPAGSPTKRLYKKIGGAFFIKACSDWTSGNGFKLKKSWFGY